MTLPTNPSFCGREGRSASALKRAILRAWRGGGAGPVICAWHDPCYTAAVRSNVSHGTWFPGIFFQFYDPPARDFGCIQKRQRPSWLHVRFTAYVCFLRILFRSCVRGHVCVSGGGHEPSPCDGTSVPGSFTGPFRSHSTCWHVSGIHLRLSSISHYGSNGHMSPCVVWWIPWFGPRIHPGLGILPFPSPGEDSPSCPGLSERG